MNLFTINEETMREMLQQAIDAKAEQLAQEKVFWTMKDLEKYTNLCANTMKEHFFYDPDFPKFKIGRDWRFPVAKVKAYLEQWSEDQIDLQKIAYV